MILFCTRLRSDTRGSVYVEALSMLPVLIILWVSVVFTHHIDDTAQQSRLASRQCAWEYTEGNCESVPPSCKSEPTLGEPMEDDTDIKSKIESRDGADNDKDSTKGFGNGIMEMIGDIFGKPAEIRDVRDVRAPELYGGGAARQASKQYLLCNEKEVDFLKKALEVGGKLAGDVW